MPVYPKPPSFDPRRELPPLWLRGVVFFAKVALMIVCLAVMAAAVVMIGFSLDTRGL